MTSGNRKSVLVLQVEKNVFDTQILWWAKNSHEFSFIVQVIIPLDIIQIKVCCLGRVEKSWPQKEFSRISIEDIFCSSICNCSTNMWVDFFKTPEPSFEQKSYTQQISFWLSQFSNEENSSWRAKEIVSWMYIFFSFSSNLFYLTLK